MTVDIRKRPVTDLDALEAAKKKQDKSKDDKVKDILEKVKNEDEGETEEKRVAREEAETAEAERIANEKKQVEDEKDKKLIASQQEALVLREQVQRLEAEKNKVVEVTEEFMKEKYQDWDDMTSGEQRALTEVEKVKQENAEIRAKSNEFNNDKAWGEKVAAFVEDPTFAESFAKIVGREEDFKRFAGKPTRKGLPLEDLAKIFLYENPTTPVEHKRSLFNSPGGIGKGQPPRKGLTSDEIRILRINSPKKYNELVRQHKIKAEI